MQQYKRPDIIKQIEQGEIYPVYLLYGKDDFLVDKTVDKMTKILLDTNTRDFNLSILEGIDTEVPEILTLAETYPVMSDRRLVIVKNLPFFKKGKGPSKTELLKNAVDAYDAGSEKKAVSSAIRALQIYDEENLSGIIENFVSGHGDELETDELDFLSELPELVSEADLQFKSSDDEMQYLLEWLDEDLPLSNIVVFTCNEPVDEQSRLVKAIDKVGIVVDFSLKQDEVYKWIASKLREYDKKISSNASKKLRDRAGDSIRLISEELEKIVAYVGNKKQIEVDDIEQVVTWSREESIFTFTDAIAKRKISLALLSLHHLLNDREPPIKINAMIIRQIRLMLQARLLVERGIIKKSATRMRYNNFKNYFGKLPSSASKQLPKSKKYNLLKQHPYPAHQILQSINYYTTEELIKGLEILLEADMQLKSSVSSPKAILEEVIFELCEKPGVHKPRYSRTVR